MRPASESQLIERTLKRLRTALPDLPDLEKVGEDDLVLRLPARVGADYLFNCTFHGPASNRGRGRLIEAALRTKPIDRPDRPSMFWHCPFEPTSPQSEEALADAFDALALALVCAPTRIVQSRGLLFWKFVLEALSPDGSWQRQGGSVLALRLGYEVPPIVGRQHVYSAPACASARNAAPSSS